MKICFVQFLFFVGVFWVQGQDENMNFCDMVCVRNIYRFYCGAATCTTGASDYGQIFSLCTETCASAVAGEVMMECLTTTDPNREDWDNVQASVLSEIVDFCLDYEIIINPDVPPLTRQDTDKELLDTLFEDPDAEEEDKQKSKKKKKSRKDKQKDQDEQDESKGDEQEQNNRSRRESRERTTEESEDEPGDSTSFSNQDEVLLASEAMESTLSEDYLGDIQRIENGLQAVGCSVAEEIEVEEFLESDLDEASTN